MTDSPNPAKTLPWFKVTTDLFEEPDFLALPPTARLLYLGCYARAARLLTDGALSEKDIAVVIITQDAGGEDAAQLVERGFLAKTESGYQIVRFESEQLSKSQVESERAKARKRQKKHRESRRDNGRESPPPEPEPEPEPEAEIKEPPYSELRTGRRNESNGITDEAADAASSGRERRRGAASRESASAKATEDDWLAEQRYQEELRSGRVILHPSELGVPESRRPIIVGRRLLKEDREAVPA